MSNSFNAVIKATGEVTGNKKVDFETGSKVNVEIKANGQYYTINHNAEHYEWLQKNIKRGDITTFKASLQSVQKGDKTFYNLHGWNPQKGRNFVKEEENARQGVFCTIKGQAESIKKNEEGELSLNLTVRRETRDGEQHEDIHPAIVTKDLQNSFLKNFENGDQGKFKAELSGFTEDEYGEVLYEQKLTIKKAEKTE